MTHPARNAPGNTDPLAGAAATKSVSNEAAETTQPTCSFDPTAVRFDHHDPSWSHDNVWERYAQLREQCPVSRGEKYGGYWVLSRYADVKAATEDHDTFSSAQGMFLPNYSTIRIPPIEFDPPEHTWMRRVIAPMVNAAVAKRMEPEIQVHIDELLDAIPDRRHVDLIEHFALPLPLYVMTSLWGLTGVQRDAAREYSYEFLTGGAEELHRGVDYWRTIIASRQVELRDDFVSKVLAINSGRPDGDRMSDDEMAILMWSLTYAGHDSTALTLGNSLGHLAEHPHDRAGLIANPDTIPDAIEEILRYYTPLHQFRRTITHPTDLRGVQLDAGDPVMLVYASANRDSAAFDNPDQVDLTRTPNPHMAFGGGIHGCPGRFLARTEIKLALRTILGSYPDFRLLEPAERTSLEGGGRHMGVRKLLVDLEPNA